MSIVLVLHGYVFMVHWPNLDLSFFLIFLHNILKNLRFLLQFFGGVWSFLFHEISDSAAKIDNIPCQKYSADSNDQATSKFASCFDSSL